MNLPGTRLTVLIGETVPAPAPVHVLEALDDVSVTHTDSGRSGFQLRFRAGRARENLLDYGLLQNPLLQPCSRVVLIATFNGAAEVLMDGIITQQQLAVGGAPGTTTLTVTGEDVSVQMDREEKSVEHPAQPEAVIAMKIIASYARYGLVPMVIPPPTVDVPLPTERIPVQQETDLAYLRRMAERFGYVFYVSPGPAPMSNIAYWGPPVRTGIPQKALSVNIGPDTNVLGDIDFSFDGTTSTRVEGQLRDRRLNETVAVRTVASTRPPLASMPVSTRTGCVSVRQLRESGLDTAQAYARAQGIIDEAADRAVSATGRLDAARYGRILRPRGLVGLRGAGYTFDGVYYVQSVTHQIRRGQYHQNFQLRRDGLGALAPVVTP